MLDACSRPRSVSSTTWAGSIATMCVPFCMRPPASAPHPGGGARTGGLRSLKRTFRERCPALAFIACLFQSAGACVCRRGHCAWVWSCVCLRVLLVESTDRKKTLTNRLCMCTSAGARVLRTGLFPHKNKKKKGLMLAVDGRLRHPSRPPAAMEGLLISVLTVCVCVCVCVCVQFVSKQAQSVIDDILAKRNMQSGIDFVREGPESLFTNQRRLCARQGPPTKGLGRF